jgi:hypothetical protein
VEHFIYKKMLAGVNVSFFQNALQFINFFVHDTHWVLRGKIADRGLYAR